MLKMKFNRCDGKIYNWNYSKSIELGNNINQGVTIIEEESHDISENQISDESVTNRPLVPYSGQSDSNNMD